MRIGKPKKYWANISWDSTSAFHIWMVGVWPKNSWSKASIELIFKFSASFHSCGFIFIILRQACEIKASVMVINCTRQIIKPLHKILNRRGVLDIMKECHCGKNLYINFLWNAKNENKSVLHYIYKSSFLLTYSNILVFQNIIKCNDCTEEIWKYHLYRRILNDWV